MGPNSLCPMGIGRLARASRATYSKPWRHLVTKYLVDVYRDGKWWMANVAAVDVLTQSRRLVDVERNAREAIAVTLDTEPSDIDIKLEIRPIGGVDVEAIRAEIERAHAAATVLEKEASAKAQHLTQSLAMAGVPLRDIGTLVGFSHQRAHQLLD